MRALVLAAASAALALLTTACQGPHTFATPDASWKSHVGQLKHTNAQRVLIGEVVVQRRGAGEFQLDYLKGGSFPLISIRQDATTTRAEGLLARGRWQGQASAAPASLRPWLTLRDAFAQPKANPAGTPITWQGGVQYEGGQLRSLSLVFPQEKQSFQFQFNR